MEDIFVQNCRKEFLDAQLRHMTRVHANLQNIRHKEEKDARSSAILSKLHKSLSATPSQPKKRSSKETAAKKSSVEHKKYNLVYCKPESRNKGRKRKSSRGARRANSSNSNGGSEPKKAPEPTRTSRRLRGKERRSYIFEDEIDESPEESSGSEEPKKEEELEPFYKCERILAVSTEISETNQSGSKVDNKNKDDPAASKYLVKMEGVSYRHCQWMTVREMNSFFGEKVVQRRLRSFLRDQAKLENQNIDYWEGEHFNPLYLEVDRILAEKTKKIELDANGHPTAIFPTAQNRKGELAISDPGEATGTKPQRPLVETVFYLIKWKELSYTQCTWELASEVKDEMKIAEFRRFNRPPVIQHRSGRPMDNHPNPMQWYAKSRMYKGGNKLRFYQVHGLNWLIGCYLQQHNGILADEMGLGKTIQIVAFLDHLKQVEHIYGPHLIVVPLSMVQNWRREVERWSDMNAVVYHDMGRKPGRQLIEKYEWFYRHVKRAIKFNVLITTYEIVQSDTDVLANIPWATMIIDEGHKLKNRQSRILTDLHRVKGKENPLIVLLTGTPIQNNAEELWALLNFIEPEIFSSLEEFHEQFGDLSQSDQIARLQEKITPFMLRRMKETVEKDIPPKEEIIIDIELTTLQKQYYRAVYTRNAQFLRSDSNKKSKNNVNLVNIEIQLRKCCNHPWLLGGVEEKETGVINKSSSDFFEKMINASGKMVLLDKLLDKLKKEGHRVLIFSQMKRMLDILERYMDFRAYKYERIDGGITGNERQRAIDRFCRPNSNRFVFLLSTRAGGVGLNLTQADTVIIFDLDWNPQQDMQAQARAHRIGQKKGVSVYRLVTRNTYESEMFVRASKKLGLDHAVLHDMGMKKDLKNKRPDDIDRILRYGVYGLLDNDEEKSRKFCESDINDILKTRTRVISTQVTDSKKDPLATASVGNINYSKIRFESENADGDIDIDDPEFWDKVLPGSVDGTTPSDLLAQLTGGSLTSKKELEAFFEKLEAVSERVIQARQQGDVPPEVNELIDLLIQFSLMSRFPKSWREKAENWCDTLQKRPNRRAARIKRKRQQPQENEENEDDDNVGDDDEESDGRVEEETPKVRSSSNKGRASLNRGRTSLNKGRTSVNKGRTPTNKGRTPTNKGRTLSSHKRSSKRRTSTVLSLKIRNGSGTGTKRSNIKANIEFSAQAKKAKPVAGKFNARICDECHKPGELLLCDGTCERAFHVDCIRPDADPLPQEDEIWLCSECEAQVHACFKCGTYAHVEREDSGMEKGDIKSCRPKVKKLLKRVKDNMEPVRQCSISPCGRYYHINCIHMLPLAKFIGDINAGYQSFRCPLHYCRGCRNPANNRHLLNCVSCPNAYHVSCLGKGQFTRLTKKHMYCPACHAKAVSTKKGKEAIEAAAISTQFIQLKEQQKTTSAGAGRKKRSRKDSLTLALPRYTKYSRIVNGEPYEVRFFMEDDLILEESITFDEDTAE